MGICRLGQIQRLSFIEDRIYALSMLWHAEFSQRRPEAAIKIQESIGLTQSLFFAPLIYSCSEDAFSCFLIFVFLSAGEIGGNLGLFLGCSILTIFEFIDFAIYLCRTRNKKKS